MIYTFFRFLLILFLFGCNSKSGKAEMYKLENTVHAHYKGVTAIDFNDRGDRIISGSEDSTVRLWKKNGDNVATFRGHLAPVRTVRFFCNYIFSGGDDKTIHVWNTNWDSNIDNKSTGCMAIIRNHKGAINRIFFDTNRKILISTSQDKTVSLYDMTQSKLIKKLKHKQPVKCGDFSSTKNIIVSGCIDGTIQLWDIRDQKNIFINIPKSKACINSISFNKDGSKFVCGSDEDYVSVYYTNSFQYDISFDGKLPVVSKVNAVCFNPNKEEISSGWHDGNLRICTNNKQEYFDIDCHKHPITSLCYSPDGRRIITGSSDQTFNILKKISSTNRTRENKKEISICNNKIEKQKRNIITNKKNKPRKVTYKQLIEDNNEKDNKEKENDIIIPNKNLEIELYKKEKSINDHNYSSIICCYGNCNQSKTNYQNGNLNSYTGRDSNSFISRLNKLSPVCKVLIGCCSGGSIGGGSVFGYCCSLHNISSGFTYGIGAGIGCGMGCCCCCCGLGCYYCYKKIRNNEEDE